MKSLSPEQLKGNIDIGILYSLWYISDIGDFQPVWLYCPSPRKRGRDHRWGKNTDDWI